MSTQVILELKTGEVVLGVNYRMNPAAVPTPSVPDAPPVPFDGNVYHIETARGWRDIPATQVLNVSIVGGAHT